MKLYVNREPVYGPWGGGSKTVNKLVELSRLAGHEVVFRLERDIDIIFCIDPRPNNYGEWYQNFIDYKINHNAKIIQRVGDIGTHGKPNLTDLVKQTLKYSDYLIFPSDWAKNTIGFQGENYRVIYNKPMKEFYENRNENVKTSSIPKLVTHHWSTNPKKGFEFYKKLDKFCKETNKFEFTYIGRKPDNCKFVNSLPPIDVEKLSKELPKHDIYITASIEEAGANHVLEALACALPVVYHKLGGSIEDYCNNYGKAYMTFDESVNSIETIVKDYQTYKDNVLKYNVTNDDTINEYLNIIEGFI